MKKAADSAASRRRSGEANINPYFQLSTGQELVEGHINSTWINSLPTGIQPFLNGRNGKGDVYAYDMAYRMVDTRYDVTNPATEVATPGSQTYVTKQVYTLDGLGNRSQTQQTPWGGSTTTVSYSFNAMNEYTAIGGTSRTHDSNGNLTDDGTQTYHYDYKNRLVEVRVTGSSTVVAKYKYDALGRRVEKHVVSGAVTTRYILDGQDIVEEFDGNNTWLARYFHEDRIDHPRAMDRADISDVDGDSNTSEILRFTYHQNALGSVSEISAPGGGVVEWVTYDAYGKATARNSAGTTQGSSYVGNPFLFTGREFDAESGMYHYRARAYDPEAGRFLQRDPLGYVDGLGAYQYAHCAPATCVDPFGTWSFLGPMIEAALADYAKENGWDGKDPKDIWDYWDDFVSDQRVYCWLVGVRFRKDGKGSKSKKGDKDGGYEQAQEDFEDLVGGGEIEDRGDTPTTGRIRTGELPNGSTVTERERSKEGPLR